MRIKIAEIHPSMTLHEAIAELVAKGIIVAVVKDEAEATTYCARWSSNLTTLEKIVANKESSCEEPESSA